MNGLFGTYVRTLPAYTHTHTLGNTAVYNDCPRLSFCPPARPSLPLSSILPLLLRRSAQSAEADVSPPPVVEPVNCGDQGRGNHVHGLRRRRRRVRRVAAVPLAAVDAVEAVRPGVAVLLHPERAVPGAVQEAGREHALLRHRHVRVGA